MGTLKKVYLEITNVCNLDCSFCPGTRRTPGFLSPEQFRLLAEKLRPHTKYLYLHLMGEPLLHPQLGELLAIAGELGLLVMITTNGTLLPRAGKILLTNPAVHKVSISLHSFEANKGDGFEDYIESCTECAEKIGKAGKFAVLRLWNEGGLDSLNEDIFALIKKRFPQENWEKTRRGMRVGDHVFVEFGEKFVWPDGENIPEIAGELETDCHALLSQYAILCDGTVVPCCLDRNGDIPLGNIFEQTPEEILSSPRAKTMRDGIAAHRAVEKLCATCSKRCGAFQK